MLGFEERYMGFCRFEDIYVIWRSLGLRCCGAVGSLVGVFSLWGVGGVVFFIGFF